MAKSWKSFVSKAENQQEQEILHVENALQISLEDLARHNEALQKVLKERENLEAKMQQMLQKQTADKTQENPRFGSIITSIDEKRKADEKRFLLKRSLEIKIAEKNKEIQAWEEKKKAFKAKIDKNKNLLERHKKRIGDFQVKATKLKDDFDKQGAPGSKSPDEFLFTEKKFKKKEDDFPLKEQVNKPKEKPEGIKERLKNQPRVKKIKDEWEKRQEIEQETLARKKQNKILALKDNALKTANTDKINESFKPKKIEPLLIKEKEEKKKINLLERLKAKREERKENKVWEKVERKENKTREKEERKENKPREKEAEPKIRQEKKVLSDKPEKRQPKQKENQFTIGIRNKEPEKKSYIGKPEVILQKRKKEQEKEDKIKETEKKSYFEKREELLQKRKEAQETERKEALKREQRREQRQEEYKNRKKDKYNY